MLAGGHWLVRRMPHSAGHHRAGHGADHVFFKIERLLRLRQHAEPGLCRGEFVEGFTMVQLSNGMVLTLQMAKQMGYVPPDATLG